MRNSIALNMWKDWFYFSKREQNGIIVLFVFILLLLAARLFFTGIVMHPPYDYSEYQAKIDSLQLALRQDSVMRARLRNDHFDGQLFRFDPNTADSLELRKLGFGSESIENILRYRKAGGRFEVASDLGRIYSISQEELHTLQAYISISPLVHDEPKKKAIRATGSRRPAGGFDPKNEKATKPTKVKTHTAVELNSADTAQLRTLYGIGEVLAERIVKYRDWLGGFYHVNQLGEVYGVKNETLQSLLKQLSVDTLGIKKIEVNRVSVSEMKNHPYINFYQAKAIVDYREDKGEISGFGELIKIDGLDTTKLVNARPYFDFSVPD